MQEWLDAYAVSHQNLTNKLIHWVCVPAIMFSLFGLLYSIPVVGEKTTWFNWCSVAILIGLIFYARLSVTMFFGFLAVSLAMLWGNVAIASTGVNLVVFSIAVFVIAWIGQFIGHKIEGAKPSFFEDVQYLLIGPAWLLSFIFNKLGIKY